MLASVAIGALAALPRPAAADADAPIPAAIAAFDNYDTAGEAPDAAEAHAARVAAFAGLLAETMAAEGQYRLVNLDCVDLCSAGSLPPADLVAAARRSGARLLVYGGIHKMSTLVQMGKVQAIDLDGDRLVLDRSFSFRGDSDEAFRRAAAFLARYLVELAGEL